MPNPPVKIANIAIGNGNIGEGAVWNLVPAVRISPSLPVSVYSHSLPQVSFIETFPQMIGYDPQVYKYFKAQ